MKQLDADALIVCTNEIISIFNDIVSFSKTIPQLPKKNFTKDTITIELIDLYDKENLEYNEYIKKHNLLVIGYFMKISEYLEILGVKNVKIPRTSSLLSDIIESNSPIKKIEPIRYYKDTDIKIFNEIEKNNKKQKEEQEKKDRQIKACKWLMDRGKKYGEDFTEETSIQLANEISAEEEIAKMKKNNDFIEFGGNDYCENCAGWDMESHRCQCGNRRVYFDTTYNKFDEPWVYAQAD